MTKTLLFSVALGGTGASARSVSTGHWDVMAAAAAPLPAQTSSAAPQAYSRGVGSRQLAAASSNGAVPNPLKVEILAERDDGNCVASTSCMKRASAGVDALVALLLETLLSRVPFGVCPDVVLL